MEQPHRDRDGEGRCQDPGAHETHAPEAAPVALCAARIRERQVLVPGRPRPTETRRSVAAAQAGLRFTPVRRALVASFRESPRLRRALVAVFALYAAYLVAANVFLGFHLLDRIVTSDDGTVELRTGRAWSLFPGRASVRDFVLRLDGDTTQLRITVAEADASVSLWRLFRRELRISGVEARDASVRVRLRVETIHPGNADRVAAYPDIEGALGPPLLSAAKAVPATPVEEAWDVDLRDVDVTASEVWIQEYRLTGNVSAAGGFAVWPGKDFTLHPSKARVGAGLVRVGPREVTRDLEITTATAEITTLSLVEVGAAKALALLTASVSGTSTLQDASFLDVYAEHHVPHVRVEPSATTFDARFVRGQFVQGTTSRILVPHGSITMPGAALQGAVVLRVQVPHDGELELGADSDAGQLSIDALPSTKSAPWTLHGTSVRQVLHVVVGEPFQVTVGAYKGEVRTPTLGWFEDLAELGVQSRGRAGATFDLQRDADGPIHGSWKAHVDDGVFSSDSLTVNVSNRASGQITTKKNPAEGVTVSGAHVEAPGAAVRATGFAPHATWLRVDVPSAFVATEPRFEARVTAAITGGDGGLVAGVVESRLGLVLGPIAAHFLVPPAMSALVGVAAVNDDVTFEASRATVGAVDAKGFWFRHRGRKVLAAVLQHAPLSIGVRIDDGVVPLVVPAAPAGWLETQRH